jgi:hypothetical protein
MTMSSAGFLYLVEGENNVIRTIDTVGGVIWTVAGVGAEQFRFGGDGMAATLAPLWQPHGVLVDQKGSLTISDTKNHRVRVLTPIGGTGR